MTVLPDSVVPELRRHLRHVRLLHEDDLAEGSRGVSLLQTLAAKYPHARREWKWQFVFPSKAISIDPRSREKLRHHIHPSSVQKAIRRAAASAGIIKHVTPHTLRHSFATHLLEHGYDIRAVQELLGYRHVTETMIHTHVLSRAAAAVQNPLDRP